jgi:hypothetical protein
MADQEVLRTILEMLHRLEAILEERSNSALSDTAQSSPRTSGSLTTREVDDDNSITSPRFGSPCSCVGTSIDVRAPIMASGGHDYRRRLLHDNGYHLSAPEIVERRQQQSALAYLATMAKLRNRFALDSASDLGQDQEVTTNPVNEPWDTANKIQSPAAADGTEDDSDWRSVSVYPSRPLSRLDFGTPPPVPQLPDLDPQRQDVIQVPAVIYENTQFSPASTSSDHASSAPRTSQSGSLHSSGTGQSSIGGESSFGTMSKSASYAVFTKIRGSLKRSISLRTKSKGSLSGREEGGSEMPTATRAITPEEAIVTVENNGMGAENAFPTQTGLGKPWRSTVSRLAKKGSWYCVAPFSLSVSWVGRAIVSQQMKMLDAAA